MKKIIGLTIAFMLLIGMTSIGTWAYFSDVETSTGNVLAAGTLDLKTDDADGVTQTLFATNMAPGDTVGPETITLKNIGSVDGSTLDLVFSYVESDDSPNPANMTANATAAVIELTTLNYGGTNLITSVPVADDNSNGWIDMQDVAGTDLSGQTGIDASGTRDFTITVLFRGDADHAFQADGITVTMTFTLNQ